MQIAPGATLWHGAFLVALSALYLFAGYRTLRFTAKLNSGLLLFAVGMGVSQHFGADTLPSLAIGLGGGILGFLLGNAFYFVTMALTGLIAGAALGGLGSWLASGMVAVNIPLTIAAALVFCAAAVAFERPIGILSTSMIGGMTGMAGTHALLTLSGAHAPNRFLPGYLALSAGLTIAGCIFQAKSTKNLPPRQAGASPPRA